MDGNSMSSYARPWFLFNGHLETIYPALARRVALSVMPESHRLPTPDGDLLELDFYPGNSDKVVIINHGLEGNSKRAYVLGMVKILLQQNFNVIAWNYRGCGTSMSHILKFYHSGATEDLEVVCRYCASRFESVYIVGFSLGGNLALKYLGEPTWPSHGKIKGGVAISVPLDLESSGKVIDSPSNWVYQQRFLRSLKAKVKRKHTLIEVPEVHQLEKVKSIRNFDDLFTSRLHGFQDAHDYYTKCSAIHRLEAITVPTLIVNALNDPFLSPACFPDISNPTIQAVYPRHGGHVGFASVGKNNVYWSEENASNFIKAIS